jgi:pilus assembly protein CpaE
MSICVGMPRGQLLDRMAEAIPAKLHPQFSHDKVKLLEHLEKPCEWIIVHVEMFADSYPWEWVPVLRERQPKAGVIVVQSETVYDSLWSEVLARLAGEAGVVLTPLGAGTEEIAGLVMQEVFGTVMERELPGSSGLVAAVWSAACKDGATTIAVSTALALARHTPLRVGLIDGNLKNPEMRVMLQLAESGRSNVSLRPKLQTGSLHPKELWEAAVGMRKTPNLRILPGTFRRDTAGDVSADMIASLLDVCRRTFDVTIIDVSSYPDNAATVCAVRSADVRWLVAQNRKPSYLWSWSEWYACYWSLCGITSDRIQLVLNRFDAQGERPEKAAKAIGMELAGIVPNALGDRNGHEGEALYDDSAHTEFADGIHRLASSLSVAAGGAALPEQAPARRTGFVSLLSGLF